MNPNDPEASIQRLGQLRQNIEEMLVFLQDPGQFAAQRSLTPEQTDRLYNAVVETLPEMEASLVRIYNKAAITGTIPPWGLGEGGNRP